MSESKKIYFHSQFFDKVTQDELDKAKQFKKIFPNGVVKKFILAHEGVTNSKVIGSGNKFMKWSRNVIQNFFSKIKKGIQVIKGHTLDNNLRNEKTLGEIIDIKLDNINNKNVIVGLVGLYDKQDSDYDSISAEADVLLDNESNVVSVVDVLRFALGKLSNGDIPAFKEAVELNTIHCFSQEFIDNNQEIINSNQKFIDKEVKKMDLSFKQIKEYIREHNIFPTQIWSVSELIGTPKIENNEVVFLNSIDDRITSYLAKSIPDFKQYEEKIKQYEERINALSEAEKKLSEYEKKEKFIEFKKKVFEKADEKKVSEKLKKLLTKKIDKYSKEIVDVEKDAEQFIAESADELNDILAEVSELTSSESKQISPSELRDKAKLYDDQF